MKILKASLILFLCLVTAAAIAGCKSSSSTTGVAQTATVKSGNLTVAITASGNLSLSHTENLAFQTTGTGTVTSVAVQLGDIVKQGEQLAALDTTAFNDQIATLQEQLTVQENSMTAAQHTLISKQNALTSAQHQLTAAQNALVAAQHNLIVKQDGMTQAQINVQTAQYNLNVIADVQTANTRLTNDQNQLQIDTTNLQGSQQSGANTAAYQQNVNADNAAIAQDKIILADVLSGHSTTLSPDVNTQVALKNLALQQANSGLIETQNGIQDAQAAVNQAQNSVDDAKASITDAQNAIEEATAAVAVTQNSVNTAQTNLTQTQAQSPIITAPFDGFISVVNVTQGQQIYNGQVAVQLADPTQFEVDVLVSEQDIFNVSIGQTATVSMNALPGVVLPAKVSKISQTATISSGVVNYSVAVQVTSLQPIASTGRATGGTRTTGSVAPSATGGSTPSASSSSATSTAAATPQPTAPTAQAAAIQLKAGLTATASIIVTQRTNVLLVPVLAVITQSTGQYVQVLKNGVTTQVPVQIGASDFQNAEVISGLSAGDVVVIPQTTTTGTGGSGGPSFFPGVRLGG